MINTDDEKVKKYIIIIFICISVALNIYFAKKRDPSTAINMGTVLQYNHERLFVLFKKNIEKFKNMPLLIHRDKEFPGLFLLNEQKEQIIIHTCADFEKLNIENIQPATVRDSDVMVRFFRECNFLRYGEPATPAKITHLDHIKINDVQTWPHHLIKFLFGIAIDESGVILRKDAKEIEILVENHHYLIQEIARADFDNDGSDNILIFVKKSSKGSIVTELRYVMIKKELADSKTRIREIDSKILEVQHPGVYKLPYPKRQKLFGNL